MAMTWPDQSPMPWSRMSLCCLPCDLMKIEKSQGICRLPAVCSVIVEMGANLSQVGLTECFHCQWFGYMADSLLYCGGGVAPSGVTGGGEPSEHP